MLFQIDKISSSSSDIIAVGEKESQKEIQRKEYSQKEILEATKSSKKDLQAFEQSVASASLSNPSSIMKTAAQYFSLTNEKKTDGVGFYGIVGASFEDDNPKNTPSRKLSTIQTMNIVTDPTDNSGATQAKKLITLMENDPYTSDEMKGLFSMIGTVIEIREAFDSATSSSDAIDTDGKKSEEIEKFTKDVKIMKENYHTAIEPGRWKTIKEEYTATITMEKTLNTLKAQNIEELLEDKENITMITNVFHLDPTICLNNTIRRNDITDVLQQGQLPQPIFESIIEEKQGKSHIKQIKDDGLVVEGIVYDKRTYKWKWSDTATTEQKEHGTKLLLQSEVFTKKYAEIDENNKQNQQDVANKTIGMNILQTYTALIQRDL